MASGLIPGILALIVTYNGEETIRGAIASVTGQPILIIDNASQDETVSVIRSSPAPDLDLMVMPDNVGVAEAYNIGIEEALKRGYEWLFVLDQDSVCSTDCLRLLSESAEYLVARGERLAAVCPTVKNSVHSDVIHYPFRWKGWEFEPVCDDGRSLVPVDSTVTSGTLYALKALVSVKGFRGEYFIDFVDHDCHLRLRRSGWSLWWCTGAVLRHRLGRRQKQTEDGLWIEHEPRRYYYMARNMTDGYFRLGGLRALCHFLLGVRKHILRLKRYGAEPNKSVYYILKGLADAARRKFGRLDSSV